MERFDDVEKFGASNCHNCLKSMHPVPGQRICTSCKQNIINDCKGDGINISSDELFQVPPPKKDCQICLVPMPYSYGMSGVHQIYMSCCGKTMCHACMKEGHEEMKNGTIKPWCAFCRVPIHTSNKEYVERLKRRMEVNDANAFYKMGCLYESGNMGFRQDSAKALELWNQAAEMGSIQAHYHLGFKYYRIRNEDGRISNSNREKALHHYLLAALGGHEEARYRLGNIADNVLRSIQHYMISAGSGHNESLKKIGEFYKAGYATKDEYATALRTHKDSQDEMKTEQRRNPKYMMSKGS